MQKSHGNENACDFIFLIASENREDKTQKCVCCRQRHVVYILLLVYPKLPKVKDPLCFQKYI